MDSDRPYLSLVPEWQHGDDQPVAETPIFTLRARRAFTPSSPREAGRFVYLDSADWVNVVAVTEDRRVALIEQYRHGLDAVTLEIPGGIVEAGETPLAAGIRELREETGLGGGRARVIGKVSPNPAILNNWCHTVLVEGVAPVDAPSFEEHEEIAVRMEPLDRLADLVREGWIHHALVVAAFQHLWLREGR